LTVHKHHRVLYKALQQGVRQGILIRNVAKQERLGHSSVATTLDIYSHVLPGLQEAAARRFEEGLQSASPASQAAHVLEEDVGKMSATLP
jgi:integrase